jgi:hypothetical protein
MSELGVSTSLWLLPLRHLPTADESLSSEKYFVPNAKRVVNDVVAGNLGSIAAMGTGFN